MKVVLFGATGMVGSGVLGQCLRTSEVTSVVAVVRTSTGVRHEKFREIRHSDFFDYTSLSDALTGLDACFFCLGTTSAGKNESEYTKLTLDLTMAAARFFLEGNPRMHFCYISGAGADRSQRGRVMWARVRGRLENRLLELPFRAVTIFRPAYIQPVGGVRAKTALYRAFYALCSPLYPLLKATLPGLVTDTKTLGRAMIRAVQERQDAAGEGASTVATGGGGEGKPSGNIVATRGINALGRERGSTQA